jgi:hypothetical protein
MRWSDIQFHPDPRTLRQFAGLWLLFLGGLAAWKGFWQQQVLLGSALAVAAFTVGFIGLVSPARIRLVFVGATVLAFPIGWVVSHVILAFLFYGVLTPVGLIFALARRDPLLLRRKAVESSYWENKRSPSDPRAYFKQF